MNYLLHKTYDKVSKCTDVEIHISLMFNQLYNAIKYCKSVRHYFLYTNSFKSQWVKVKVWSADEDEKHLVIVTLFCLQKLYNRDMNNGQVQYSDHGHVPDH